MGLNILCAGCSKGEREQAEAVVKGILGKRAAGEPWVVSLVKVQDDWCITLEGPGVKQASLRAGPGRLREALMEATGTGGAPQDSAEGPRSPSGHRVSSSAGTVKDAHACDKCGRSYAVVYETAPDESQELAAVACPYCWQRNQVLLGESAAYTQAFRAEKLEPE